MSNTVFDSNVCYTDRFVNNHSKRIKMPNFKYIDAKIHPKFKDHIIVLSTHNFPENVNITNVYDQNMNGISDIDTKYSEEFKAAIEKVIAEDYDSSKDSLNKSKSFIKSTPVSPALNKTNEILEETKALGLQDNSDDSHDYEGGEGDEEEEEEEEAPKKKKKSKASNPTTKKPKPKSKSKAKRVVESEAEEDDEEDMEKEMDAIVKDVKKQPNKKAKKKPVEEEEDEDEEEQSEEEPKPKKKTASRTAKKRKQKIEEEEEEDEEEEEEPKKKTKSNKTTKNTKKNKRKQVSEEEDEGDEEEDEEEEEIKKKKTTNKKKVREETEDEEEDEEEEKVDKSKAKKTATKKEEVKEKDNSKDQKSKSVKASNKNQNSDEDTIEQKDDNVTSAPREEEKSSKAEEIKVQAPPPTPPPKIDLNLSLRDQFKQLKPGQQQRVVDYTMDVVMKKFKEFRYSYHGYATDNPKRPANYNKLNTEGYIIPDGEKLSTENYSYYNTDYVYYYSQQKFENIEYRPPVMKEKFQISLWRIDEYGVVKTKSKYFTPVDKCYESADFLGFTLKNSLDRENILIVETKNYNSNNILALVLDPYNLEVISEMRVNCSDPDFAPAGYEFYYDYYCSAESQYGTISSLPQLTCWNKGKYLMCGVTKPSFVPYYYFNIYDTEKKELVHKLEREGPLQKHILFDYKVDPTNPEIFFMSLWNYTEAIIVKVNVFKGTTETYSTSTGFSYMPSFYLINETCSNVYLTYSSYFQNKYCTKLYMLGLKESTKFDLEAAKGHKSVFSYSNNCYIDGSNLLTVTNNDRNLIEVFCNGQVNFKKLSSETDYSSYYDIKDMGLDNNRIVCISRLTEQQCKIEVYPMDPKQNHFYYNIKESTLVKFNYPLVLIVKGGKEMLLYNINDNKYQYLHLPSPIVMESLTISNNTYNLDLNCLMDLGDYFLAYTWTFPYSAGSNFSCTINKRYIEKSNFPKERLLGYFNLMKIKFLSKEEDALVFQFENSLLSYSVCSYGLVEKTEQDYGYGEVINPANDGLYYWKKGGKSVQYKSCPINFADRNAGLTIYESQDFLKYIKFEYNEELYSFMMTLCDELKFVKQFQLTTDNSNKRIATLKQDYYVNQDFTGENTNFTISNKMLYLKFQAYLLQPRGGETEDLALICEPEKLGLDRGLLEFTYPILSKNWLLYYGAKEKIDYYAKTEYEALLLPLFNNPKIINLSPNDKYYYKAEFFFYHDLNYLVYRRQAYGDSIIFEIYQKNGTPVQQIPLKIQGMYDASYARFYMSPSGRYMMYVEDVTNPENYEVKTTGKIVELIQDITTKEFKLAERRVIEDFYERYNKRGSSINSYYDYYSVYDFFLTDKMEILFINKTDKILMYEEIKCQNEVEKKLGKRDYNQEEFRDLSDISYTMKNGGFALYSSEEVYFLRINSELRTIMPLMRINFKLNKAQMTINKVCACPDSKLIVIALIRDSNHLLIVWDIEENREVYNFSTSKSWSFVNGPQSRAGIILNEDTYVNLDKGLINYFFEYIFQSYTFNDQNGYRINPEEDLVLEYGNIITKETIIEVSALDDLIDETSTITPENINLERIRFQVDGNTSLHFYALEYDKLALVLDFMENHRIEYLPSILMKNRKGKSPLDITLDNESPKNAELLLRKLAMFKDASLSHLFYDRFSELLSMNIKAFHEYLDSCVFQTVQMKATKYLKTKNDKNPWLVTHSSCLIDEVFIDKYCQSDEKKKLLEDKKKKEEEEKINAAKQKEDEERKRKEEEEKKGQEPSKVDKVQETMNKNSLIEKEDSDQDLLENNQNSVVKKKTKEELELEKERRKQRRLDIRAIEFDWIFNKQEGAKFLRTLANTDCLDLFSLSIIKNIVKFFWSYFRIAIVIYSLIPYLVYFSLFLVYTTYFQKKKVEDGETGWQRFGFANNFSAVVLLCFIAYFSYFEIRQILFHKLNYFMSFWNMIDLTSLIFNLVILIADLAGMYSKDVTTWMGIAVLLVWLKLFYFGRIFYSTAAMIRMVIEIAYDMKYFLLILLLTVTGFGNAYFILASSNLTDGVYFTGDTFWRAFIYAYNQSLGSFDTSAYAGTDKHLLFTIWWLNTMIVLIIMLNLLIAIMGDTFDRVQETSENNMLKELASIMVENEMLINRHRMFGEAKYIIIIQEEKADESEVSWEGKLQYLKKYMDKTVIDQSKLLKSLEKEIVQIKEKVEKKGKEMESSANKYFNVIFEKTDYVQTLIDENIQKYKPSGE